MIPKRDENNGAPLLLRVTDPVAWLARHDHDPELHQTIDVLRHADRIAEAVLLLESYIATTAPIRSQVDGWGVLWDVAVTDLSQFRSRKQIREVQHLLRAIMSTQKPKP